MVNTGNLTHRELVRKAMPLVSLSKSQWRTLTDHIETLEREKNETAKEVLETLITNQSRIEVMNNYCSYFGDVFDDTVSDKSTELVID